jgi:hypothetical protein
MNFDIEYLGCPPIPQHLRAGLGSYINHHQPTGGGLQAILENDLHGALTRADPETRAALPTIACFLHNEAPSACHGSKENVAAWLAGAAEE